MSSGWGCGAVVVVVNDLVPWQVTVVLMLFAFLFMLMHYWHRSPLCGFVSAFLAFVSAWCLPITDFGGAIYPATSLIEMMLVSMGIVVGSTSMVMLVAEV